MEVPDYIIIILIIPFILIGIGILISIFWGYIKWGFELGKKFRLKLKEKKC